jgi:hypothetical protein
MRRMVGVPIMHCQLSTQEAAAGENERFGLHAGDIYAQQPTRPRGRFLKQFQFLIRAAICRHTIASGGDV